MPSEALDVDHGQLVYPSLKDCPVESGPARALPSRSAGRGRESGGGTSLRSHADQDQHSCRPPSTPIGNRFYLRSISLFSFSSFFYLPMGGWWLGRVSASPPPLVQHFSPSINQARCWTSRWSPRWPIARRRVPQTSPARDFSKPCRHRSVNRPRRTSCPWLSLRATRSRLSASGPWEDVCRLIGRGCIRGRRVAVEVGCGGSCGSRG
jgi:hypothetical protein